MLIRYFDLGAHKGGEITRMRDMLDRDPLASSWKMYAFEAHPGLARRCRRQFKRDASVQVVQCALGTDEGTCKLFLNRNLVGSSIYSGKNNVIPGREVEVPCMRFSRWLKENLPDDWTESFNIIKSNIEGAEWDLWHDLAENDLVPAFNLWLGTVEGHDGWSEDLRKISGMESQADALAAAIKEAGVKIYRFSAFDKKVPNSDVSAVLHHRLTDVTRADAL
ncbi:MAG: FkbM family methyltransferase [Verrucomicrobia bacterium]|jgi:FkbM family methyltransferase|nr:FkbM family methyltransferase [Verrucomicrobiota bacterium]MBT7068528.1 FkbM family methyltransferase [Verrucomicrobiota bacterium]MBT7701934.1 FkbM family methyltransferase [Verrucomicrobiota bacterium]